MQNNSSDWWSNATQWIKKQYFNASHNISTTLHSEKSQQIWMFGYEFSNEQAKVIYSATIWSTYRENIKFDNSSINSDVGWGCMPRVAQMMIAQTFRRLKGIDFYNDPQTIKNILNQINKEDGQFSIQNFTLKGQKLYHKKIGDWYSPSEAANIIKSIQNSIVSSPMKVMVFDSQLQLTSILYYLSHQNKNKQKSITTSFIKKNKEHIKFSENIIIDPGLIMVLVRLGFDTPQPELLSPIVKILKEEPSCVGILGGQPGKAHYIIGTTNHSFVYLDPHCVKQNSQLSQFFCDTLLSISHEKIDTSMALCFYIDQAATIIRIVDKFQSLKMSAFYTHSIGPKPQIVEIDSNEKFQLLRNDIQQ